MKTNKITIKETLIITTTHHTPEVLVRVEAGEVFLVTTTEGGIRQLHLGSEVVVIVLVICDWVVLLGCVHDLAGPGQGVAWLDGGGA